LGKGGREGVKKKQKQSDSIPGLRRERGSTPFLGLGRKKKEKKKKAKDNPPSQLFLLGGGKREIWSLLPLIEGGGLVRKEGGKGGRNVFLEICRK